MNNTPLANKSVVVFCIVALALIITIVFAIRRMLKQKRQIENQRHKIVQKTADVLEYKRKNEPMIALCILYEESANATAASSSSSKRDDYASHCILSNAYYTPYLPHRIVSFVLKLNAPDSSFNAHSYGYYKKGNHECRLCKRLDALCTQTKKKHVYQSLVCIHCPKLPNVSKENVLYGEFKALKYVADYVDENDMNVSYTIVVHADTLLNYGWDEYLIGQYNKIPECVSGVKIISNPVDELSEVLKYNSFKKRMIHGILESQAHKNKCNDYEALHDAKIESPSSASTHKQHTTNKPSKILTRGEFYTQLLNSIHVNGNNVNISVEELAALLWHTERESFWPSIDRVNQSSNDLTSTINISLKRFHSIVGRRHGEIKPTFVPWIHPSNITFSTFVNMKECLWCVDDYIGGKHFNHFYLSLLYGMRDVKIFSSVSSVAMTALKDTLEIKKSSSSYDIKKINIVFSSDLMLSSSDLKSIYKRFGLKIRFDNSVVSVTLSKDAHLGLFGLRHEDVLQLEDKAMKDPENNESPSLSTDFYLNDMNEHDILCRFGSWGEYYAQRK